METKIARDVRFLKIYAGLITLVCAVLLLTAFQSSKNQKFAEIDVERINVVEKDGRLRMVISNEARQHPGLAGGKIIKRDGPREPGILFFNDSGEAGGLVFTGQKVGNKIEAYGGLTFDQFGQDETLKLAYVEADGWRRAALIVQDRSKVPQPEWEERWAKAKAMNPGAERDAEMELLSAPFRAYFGKTRENDSAVLLYDTKGRTRIRMMVTNGGEPKLEFLDEKGAIVQSFPAVGPSGSKR
jgi:hypothetical protein